MHRGTNIAEQHAAPKQPPPKKATRSQPARVLRGDGYVAQVSDVRVASGETATATVELQPSRVWKFNTDYPAQIALSGLSFAVTPKLELRSDELPKEHYQATSGGLRLDVPVVGKAAGVDEVRAKLRFGVCGAYSCEVRTAVLSWRITVE